MIIKISGLTMTDHDVLVHEMGFMWSLWQMTKSEIKNSTLCSKVYITLPLITFKMTLYQVANIVHGR